MGQVIGAKIRARPLMTTRSPEPVGFGQALTVSLFLAFMVGFCLLAWFATS